MIKGILSIMSNEQEIKPAEDSVAIDANFIVSAYRSEVDALKFENIKLRGLIAQMNADVKGEA